MVQLNLLTAQPDPPRCDPRVPAEMRKRLSRQCAAILERLQQGPATRKELTEYAANITARLSDLREAGYDVRCIEHDKATGRTVYKLKE